MYILINCKEAGQKAKRKSQTVKHTVVTIVKIVTFQEDRSS